MLDKHAYLIIAHNNFGVLEKLIKMLDYKHNDLYVHIDKKVENFNLDFFRALCTHSNIYFLPKRIDVKWGGQSQILTEMLLYKYAYKNGTYSWYHLLSGVDLPLAKAEKIYSFFSDKNRSYIYIQPNTSEWDKQRISRYRFNIKNEVISNTIFNIQGKININRVKNIEVKKGSNWASLTNKSVEVLLEKERMIKRMTFASLCADEVYKQTILCKYAAGTIFYDEYGNTTDLRYTDWSEGGAHPKTLDDTDYEKIMSSGKLFARKFDEEKSKKIIDRIYGSV
ncbi:beta-1,6-N-acetylglucosaminyltransferase [Ruminococcus sp.]|uniref:beta-1,6-N-acetylglucosaminyltransferase n=1 Tax=Ruminococcus sp. TaxID=41978 RepID=UPI0025D79BC8|nr:beta-1,6-N-acetylglucosaminyltransferase [Ruminococcus sp.]MBD9050137.1 hypothetical protein [Ruminococcus sp.]